jgi:hypothetical protein
VEERRGAVRIGRTTLTTPVALVAAWLAMATVVEACDVPDGFTPRGRLEAEGVVIVFRTVPDSIELGRHFALDTVVCADAGTRPTLTRLDAVMPEHRHGMNYRPSLTAKGNGRFVAEGFLFHMPGRWQLIFDVERGERRARLTTDVLIE